MNTRSIVIIGGDKRQKYLKEYLAEKGCKVTALEMLKESCKVDLYSDSKYLVDSVNLGWIKKWQSNGWKRKGSEMAKNIDLLKRLVCQLERHEVSFVWVKGHDGHAENERCDHLATSAIKSSDLADDFGYDGN